VIARLSAHSPSGHRRLHAGAGTITKLGLSFGNSLLGLATENATTRFTLEEQIHATKPK
jgi:hypothetical protein